MRLAHPRLIIVLTVALLTACSAPPPAAEAPAAEPEGHTMNAAAAPPPSSTSAANAEAAPRQAAQAPPISLDPSQGEAIGASFQAFLSPHQEPGEEVDTPGFVPDQFRSTAPSLLRAERTSRGHGTLRFSNDLSRAFVDVQIENIDPATIVMFHIHCGRPDQLGPIIVDFALITNIQENFADGTFSVEVTNSVIEATAAEGEGLVGAFTAGCPIVVGLPDKVKTVAGMEYIAQKGELYFNLHTAGQVYFGDIRGQLKPMTP